MTKQSFFSILLTVSILGFNSCNNSKKGVDAEDVIEMVTGEVSYLHHVYTQANSTENEIIHFGKTDSTVVEIERVKTGGKGIEGFKPVTGEASAPDPLFSAGSIFLTKDNKFLFVVNAGDNSVSSFSVAENGNLTLVDNKPTGQEGTANSLSFDSNTNTLYVLHAFGPNHIKVFAVDNGMLSVKNQSYTVNTEKTTDRIPTHISVSPDNKFLLVNVIFNARPKAGANGPQLSPSNAGTKDGTVVFPINEDGSLAKAIINDSGAPTPFSLTFLKDGSNRFINTFAAGNGAMLSQLNADGTLTHTKLAQVSLNAAPKGPSETCWVSIDKDNKYAYAVSFGLGSLTSFQINPEGLTVVNDEIGRVEGNGEFRALAGIPTSGPVGSWLSNDNTLYQLYPNASVMVVYQANEGSLTEIARLPIPLNSTQGIAGF